MYQLSVNSEIIQSIYNMPLGESNWLQLAELIGEELSAASIKVAIVEPDAQSLVLVEADFVANDAIENSYAVVGEGPKELLGQQAVQGVALHVDRKNGTAVNQAVGHVDLKGGAKLLVDLLPAADKEAYSSKDLWRFQYYLVHIKKALESEGAFGSMLPDSYYDNKLRRIYKLSHAESRLLVAFYHCACLKTAAEQLQRSDHTVRSQLKNIFKKTQTNNQLALFKKILT